MTLIFTSKTLQQMLPNLISIVSLANMVMSLVLSLFHKQEKLGTYKNLALGPPVAAEEPTPSISQS